MDEPSYRRWKIILGIATAIITFVGLFPHPSPILDTQPTATQVETPTEARTKPSPTPTTGNISVNSIPNGASVYLDDTYEGETPKILKDIEQGSHIITLKLEKYESWNQTISVDAGETFPLSPTLISNTSQVSNTPQVIPKVSGKINKVWFENDALKDNLKGVKIHTEFKIENLKDKKCIIAAGFYNNSDNTKLRDINGYYGVKGNVYVYDYFIPPCASSSYSDCVLFIPYNELHMNPGNAYIRFQVGILDGGNLLDASSWYSFSFTQY